MEGCDSIGTVSTATANQKIRRGLHTHATGQGRGTERYTLRGDRDKRENLRGIPNPKHTYTQATHASPAGIRQSEGGRVEGGKEGGGGGGGRKKGVVKEKKKKEILKRG